MRKQSIPQEAERSKKLNAAIAALKDVYQPDVENLIQLVYDLDGTQQQIADRLGVTREMIAMKYPKKKKESHAK